MYTTFSDIEALINVAFESHELEFKRGDELDTIDQSKTKDELVRDVSAFANAGGGTIVYGIDEDKGQTPAIAKAIWPVTNDKVTDIRLTQIIRTGLEPVFNKFDVRYVDVPGGGRIIVITVEKADTAHQCKADQKYYHRVGPSRPPMYDYEIRDVMNRRSAPVVRVHLQKAATRSANIHEYIFSPTLVNEGGRTAHLWAFEVILPEIGGVDTQVAALILEKDRLRERPRHRVFEFSCNRTPLNRQAVLLPGQSLNLGSGNGYALIKLKVQEDTFQRLREDAAPIILRLYVDDCRMEETVISFRDWCEF